MDKIVTGADLKRWREKNHLTQKKLASMIGYSESRISHIESDNEHITRRIIKRLEELDRSLHPQIKKDPIHERWDTLKKYTDKYGNEIDSIEKSLSTLLYVNVDKHGLDLTGRYLKYLSSELKYLANVERIPLTETTEIKGRLKEIFSEMAKNAYQYMVNR